MRVLLVEDEVLFAEALREALTLSSMAVDVVHDGGAALEAASINAYDVVVLDRDLPIVHGDDVAARLSAETSGPRILMLTAARASAEKVAGLQIGADDYLAKPFDLPELIARLWALGRRPKTGQPPVLIIGSVSLDPFRHTVHRFGQPVDLSRKEFAILQLLMAAGGGTVSAEHLLEKGWDENTNPFTNTIRVTVSTLRRKLGLPFIETLPGVGYRVIDDAS